MRSFCIILFIRFLFPVSAQEATLHEFFSKQYDYYNYPIEIVSQTDSTVTILSEVEMKFGKDLMLTKYSIRDTQAVFERRIHVDSLFNGWFNHKEINFQFYENNGTLAFLVEKKTKNKIQE